MADIAIGRCIVTKISLVSADTTNIDLHTDVSACLNKPILDRSIGRYTDVSDDTTNIDRYTDVSDDKPILDPVKLTEESADTTDINF